MGIVAISVIIKDKKKIGFRIIDTDTLKTKDVSYENMTKVLKDGKAKIENIDIRFGKLAGKFNSLNDFDILDISTNKYTNKKVILLSSNKNKYLIVDSIGNTKVVNSLMGLDVLRGTKKIGDKEEEKSEKRSEKKKYSIKTEEVNGLICCLGIESNEDNLDVVIDNVDVIKSLNNKEKIRSLTIGGRVKVIEPMSIIKVSNLKNLIIDSKSIIIKDNAFSHSGLEEIYIKSSNGIIGSSAFNSNKQLKKVYCDVYEIGYEAFKNCDELEEVKLKANNICEKAFRKDYKLKNINVDNIKNIHIGVFDNTGVEEIKINNKSNLTGILYGENLVNLKKVEINEEITVNECIIRLKTNVEMYINKGIKKKNGNNVLYGLLIKRVKIKEDDEDKIKVYINSTNSGYYELLSSSKKDIEMIDTNLRKSKLGDIKDIKLSLLGTNKEEYVKKCLANSIKKFEDKKEFVKYSGDFKINSLNIDITKELENMMITVKGVTEEKETDELDEIDELYEFTIYCLSRHYKNDGYLMHKNLFKRLTDLGYTYLNRNIIKTKNKWIVSISIIKSNSIIGNMVICIRNKKIDFMCLSKAIEIVRLGYSSNIINRVPTELFLAGDTFENNKCYINSIGEIKSQDIPLIFKSMLADRALKIENKECSYYSILSNREELVVEVKEITYNNSRYEIKDIRNIMNLEEETRSKSTKLKSIINNIVDDKEYNKIENKLKELGKQGVYAEGLLRNQGLDELTVEDLNRLDELYEIGGRCSKEPVGCTLVKRIELKNGYSIEFKTKNKSKSIIIVVKDKNNKTSNIYKTRIGLDNVNCVYRAHLYLENIFNEDSKEYTYKNKKGEEIRILDKLVGGRVYLVNMKSIGLVVGFNMVDKKMWIYVFLDGICYELLPIRNNNNAIRKLSSETSKMSKYSDLDIAIGKIVEYALSVTKIYDSSAITKSIKNILNGEKEIDKLDDFSGSRVLLDVLAYLEK